MQGRKPYNTKQKEMLIKFFEENAEKCFSPNEIINSSELKMGSATVYRLLSKLENEGKLKRFITGEDKHVSYQYSGCEGGHFHLKCLKCGELIHSHCDVIKSMQHHLNSEHGFIVDSSRTVLYGVCGECSHFSDNIKEK